MTENNPYQDMSGEEIEAYKRAVEAIYSPSSLKRNTNTTPPKKKRKKRK